MRNRDSLRSKVRTLLSASAGATVLVVGGIAGCSIETTSGNLLSSDVGEDPGDTVVDSHVSGNLLPPDVQDDADLPSDATSTTSSDSK